MLIAAALKTAAERNCGFTDLQRKGNNCFVSGQDTRITYETGQSDGPDSESNPSFIMASIISAYPGSN